MSGNTCAIPAIPSVRIKQLLFIMFTLSGFSGLIYESIWTHYLKLFLGHAAYAQTLVIAIFMGGMAIGSALATRVAPEKYNVLKGYAIAEAVVGCCALSFHLIFTGVMDATFEQFIPRLTSPESVTAIKWGLGTLLILPQSILLGMTFPLMTVGILKYLPEQPGKTLSTLYFFNSIGGAVGVLASGFFLVKAVGLPGTIICAGTINLILATVVWKIATHLENSVRSENPSTAVQQNPETVGSDVSYRRILLLIAFGTGLASFMYEIGWIRMLAMVLGSSTHAFELMLSAFIIGLACGSLWIRQKIDHIESPVRFLASVQIVMGILAVATLPVYGKSFEVMQWIFYLLKQTNPSVAYSLFNLGSHGIALMVMLPAAFCAGMTLPLITHSLLRQGHGSRSIGAVYCANTVGAIAGVFVAIHVAMPCLGLKGLILAGACIDTSLGLLLLFRCGATRRLITAAVACTAVICAAIYLVQLDYLKMASGVYRSRKILDQSESQIIAHRDGKSASISMLANKNGTLVINTNGKPDASINMGTGGRETTEATMDEATMVLTGAMPQFLHPKATSAAVIGFGSGLTSHVLLTSRTMQQVDTIEIEPAMVEVARGFYPRNSRAYNDPRSHIHYEDAKTFFSSRNARYDIIVSEPSNPWVSGVAGLFTSEYYRLVARHLSQGGLLVQWLQTYEFNDNLTASVLKSISDNFSDYQIFFANNYDMVIVAGNSPIHPLDQAILANPELASELHRVHINSLQDIEVRRTGNKKVLEPWIRKFTPPANSDYFPYVDQNAAQARLLSISESILQGFVREPFPLQEIMGVPRSTESITSFSPNPLISNSIPAYYATVFRDLLAVSAPGKIPDFLPGINKDVVSGTRELLMACTNQDDKLLVMLSIALQVVPYLQKHELESVWQRLASWRCMSNLSGAEQGWAELIKSVGTRDSKRISRATKQLLAKQERLTKARLTYLVASAMTAEVSMGNKGAAFAVWQQYKALLFQDNAPPGILFQILEAHATTP